MKNNCRSNVGVWCLELFLEVPIKLHFLWAIQALAAWVWAGDRGMEGTWSDELWSIMYPPKDKEWGSYAYITIKSASWIQTVLMANCLCEPKLTGQMTSPSETCIPGLITCKAQNSVAKMGSLYDKYCKLYLTVDTMHQRPYRINIPWWSGHASPKEFF